ncbi:MAG: hemolysin family protein [Nitriliruptoraceae bacterium]
MLTLAVAADPLAGGSVSWVALALGAGLLVANGCFVAVEIGLLAARRSRIEQAAQAGDRRAVQALQALRELSITFSGAQLGITVSSLGLGAVAQPALAVLFVEVLGLSPLPPGVVPAVAVVLALTLVVFLHMVIGETAPKNLAVSRAEAVALRLARPFAVFVALLRPLILLLNGAANALVRAVRVEPVDEHQLAHSPSELALALAEATEVGTIADVDAQVMRAALQLSDIEAGAAMTPRVDLAAIADTATGADVLEVARETGHTRFPVFHEDIDQVVGMLHVKDLLTDTGLALSTTPISRLVRPIVAVPASRDLEHLLQEMLERRAHAVLVVDEFGGTAGLLTLEDVLEELVGEIADEYDEAAPLRDDRDRVWTVPGTVRRDEVERLTGIDLGAEGDAETLSGWLVEQLGRLVIAGDRHVSDDGWVLTVRSLEGRRAGEVELRAPERTGEVG